MGWDASPITGGKDLPKKGWEFDGWNLGVNTYKLATELRGSELARGINIELIGKQSLRPRRGGLRLGGTLAGNQIDGLFQYKEGQTTNKLLAISGGNLKVWNSSTETWDTIAGVSFTADLRTRAVKLRSYLYYGNGTDPFTRSTDSDISQFNGVTAPSGLAVNPQGTPGTSSYVYTVTTVTAKGESLPATEVATSTGAETLNETDFNRVTFTRKTDAEVIGYNVYGRKSTGTGITLMKYIDQPASGTTITFDDDGTIIPTIFLPPDGDSTDGIKCAIWEQLRGSLIAAGDPNSVHRMYYSGTGDKYESFSFAHNGGYVDVRPGDNDRGVNGLSPFETKIIVGKENSIHQFYFSPDTGDAILQELITYVGIGAPGSMVVMENDIAFVDSERKLRILGYEPNYTASIRTTSLSEGRIQSLFDEIDPAYLQNCEATYFKGRYLLACTGKGSTQNDRIIPYDRRYLSFLGKWTGKNAEVRCWQQWDGKDGKKRLFAGASGEPYVFEFDVEGRRVDQDNSAVAASFRTRSEDMKNSGQQKIWVWSDIRIYRIRGTLKFRTILNGITTLDEVSFTSRTSTGWGIKKWGVTKWGISTGEGASAQDIDQTYRHEMYETANSLQHEVSKEGVDDDWTIVSMRGEALLLPTEVFDSAKMI